MKILKRLSLVVALLAVIVFGGIGLAKFVLLVQKWESPSREQEVVKK